MLSRAEIAEYIKRLIADENRGCTFRMWVRDLTLLDETTVRRATTGHMSIKTQQQLNDAIEKWRSGNYTLLSKDGRVWIGENPRPAPKMVRGIHVHIGMNGPSIDVKPFNKRDY